MATLVEFNISGFLVDTPIDGGLTSTDIDGGLTVQSAALIRACMNGTFAGVNWYADYVFPDSMPAYQMAYDYGGYCSLTFGDISLSLDMFSAGSMWPPPKVMAFSFLYAVDDDTDTSIMFEGEAYRRSYDRLSAKYSLYGPKYETDLLETVDEDYGGSENVLPRIFGAVTYQIPLRLPDDLSGYPTYHKGYLTGTKGTDWHVYDDGVNIDSKVTDNGDGTFRLSVYPVGEVTISGTGEYSTLAEIFAWACGATKLNLSINTTYARSPSPSLSYFAQSQENLIDFLSEIASFFNHLFFIRNNILYLVAMEEDYDTRTLTEHDILPVTYEDLSPVAAVIANWETKTPVTDDSVYIRTDPQEARIPSTYRYGDERNITPYHNDRTTIETQLTSILTYIHSDRASISIPLDPDLTLPLPGSKIAWSDDSMVLGVSAWIRARNIQYDFEEELIHITGEGEVSAS